MLCLHASLWYGSILSASWRRHGMETLSALLVICEGNPPVTGGFPSQMASDAGFGVLFDVNLNDLLSKQSGCRWFEMPWRSSGVHVYFTGIGPMIKLYDCSRASEVTLKNIDRFNLSQEKTIQQNIYTTVTDHKHIWWDIRELLREITRAQVSYVIQYPANIPCKHSEMGWARTLAFLLPRPGTRDQYHGWLCPDSLCRQVTSKMVLTM